MILTKAAEREDLDVTATRFIDNIGLLVIDSSIRENYKALKRVHNKIYIL